MKVIFIPNYSETNPYQVLLSNALEKLGAKVRINNPNLNWPILGLLKRYGKFDILHLHWSTKFLFTKSDNNIKHAIKSTLFIFQLLLLKLLRTRIVWTVHDIVDHESPNIKMELLFNRLIATISNEIIVLSESSRREVKRSYNLTKRNISIIPIGDYTTSYENTVSKQQSRISLEIPIDNFVYLFFGMIRPYKGVEDLIKTYKIIRNKKTCLLIAGWPLSKKIRTRIEKLCEDKDIYCFLKFIPENEIQLFMNATDIVVLPYKRHLSTSAVVLSMSFGKAIIGPCRGDISEWLRSEGGILYDQNNTNGLQHALVEARHVNLVAMGQRNNDHIKQFSWDKIALKTLTVYKSALRKENKK